MSYEPLESMQAKALSQMDEAVARLVGRLARSSQEAAELSKEVVRLREAEHQHLEVIAVLESRIAVYRQSRAVRVGTILGSLERRVKQRVARTRK